MMNKNDQILITGASGMVGKALIKLLKTEGYTNLITPSSHELNLISQQATMQFFMQFFKSEKIDYVFHLAGHIGGIKASITHPVEFLYNNNQIIMNTIYAAHTYKVRKLLFLGSSCIYPRECPQPMKEEYLLTGPLEPTNEGYALAKISGLKLCEYLNKQFGANFISLMPCNLYGYNDHFEPENSHVISALIYKMHKAKLAGEPAVEVWGSGRSRREFLFTDDIASAMLYFMNHYNFTDLGTFINIGSGVDATVTEIANMIKEVVGYKGELYFDITKPDGMPKKLMDVSKAKKLGWTATISLSDGLKLAYEDYLRSLCVSPSEFANKK